MLTSNRVHFWKFVNIFVSRIWIWSKYFSKCNHLFLCPGSTWIQTFIKIPRYCWSKIILKVKVWKWDVWSFGIFMVSRVWSESFPECNKFFLWLGLNHLKFSERSVHHFWCYHQQLNTLVDEQNNPKTSLPDGGGFYLFGVLRRFQHCTGHITTGSWKAEETSTYSSLGFCTVNCRPTASNYQLSHLRPCRGSIPGLRCRRRECYHSATVAPRWRW